MATLLTHHDKFHIHAIFGLLSLINFIYRWIMIFYKGNAFYNDTTNTATVSTLLHLGLPLTSFLLPIPEKRNYTAPMIWKEFRLHSLTFASRHVISCLIILHEKDTFYSQLLIVQVILLSASLITDKYGSHNNRTTNTMPYPQNINQKERNDTKLLYAYAQFFATAFIFADDISVSYIPLLGIQTAPFLMTLVRKGKITSRIYHMVYAWSLLLAIPATTSIIIYRPYLSSNIMMCFTIGYIVKQLRLYFSLDKHILWLVIPLIVKHIKDYVLIYIESRIYIILYMLVTLKVLAYNLYSIPHILLLSG